MLVAGNPPTSALESPCYPRATTVWAIASMDRCPGGAHGAGVTCPRVTHAHGHRPAVGRVQLPSPPASRYFRASRATNAFAMRPGALRGGALCGLMLVALLFAAASVSALTVYPSPEAAVLVGATRVSLAVQHVLLRCDCLPCVVYRRQVCRLEGHGCGAPLVLSTQSNRGVPRNMVAARLVLHVGCCAGHRTSRNAHCVGVVVTRAGVDGVTCVCAR